MRPLKKFIAIHGVPRSGTSWLGQIFNSSSKVIFRFQPLFSYAFREYLHEKSSREDIESFFQKIAVSKDAFLLQQEKIDAGSYPDFEPSKKNPQAIVYKEVRFHHILPNMLAKHDQVKIIGIVRNPLNVISSWLRAPKEFKKELGWEELEEWRYAPSKNKQLKEEYNGYEKWKEATLMFENLTKTYPERFYLLRYNHLLKNTIEEVEKLFTFCDIPLEQQTINFISESQKKEVTDPYAVYRAKPKDGSWKEELSPKIAEAIIQDIKGTHLQSYIEDEG